MVRCVESGKLVVHMKSQEKNKPSLKIFHLLFLRKMVFSVLTKIFKEDFTDEYTENRQEWFDSLSLKGNVPSLAEFQILCSVFGTSSSREEFAKFWRKIVPLLPPGVSLFDVLKIFEMAPRTTKDDLADIAMTYIEGEEKNKCTNQSVVEKVKIFRWIGQKSTKDLKKNVKELSCSGTEELKKSLSFDLENVQKSLEVRYRELESNKMTLEKKIQNWTLKQIEQLKEQEQQRMKLLENSFEPALSLLKSWISDLEKEKDKETSSTSLASTLDSLSTTPRPPQGGRNLGGSGVCRRVGV